MDIYAASSKLKAFQMPDFSLESRSMKQKSHSMPVLRFSTDQNRHPDEERGRKFDPVNSQQSLEIKISLQEPTFCDETDDSSSIPDDWLDDLEIDSPDTTLSSLDRKSTETRDWQEQIWTDALSAAVEESKGVIDLPNHGLTYVPAEVWQLSTLRSLPPPAALSKRSFVRASTTSDLPVPQARPFLRSASGQLPPPAPTAVPLSIILSNNKLSAASLPQELFGLRNLRTLALRQNEIESLSPAIGLCSSLNELNLSNNNLSYLPAEILGLTQLKNVYLANNPFLPVPSDAIKTKAGRLLGPIKRNFSVPSLVEISVRSALKRETPLGKRRHQALLANRSDLPAHLAELLPASNEPTACICSSVAHDDDVEYVRPAEERLEWIEEGRLRCEGSKSGQLVPILWRGCSKGCLDWLED